jgi:hypothetical protein
MVFKTLAQLTIERRAVYYCRLRHGTKCYLIERECRRFRSYRIEFRSYQIVSAKPSKGEEEASVTVIRR